ncbi:phosphoenolpyruvate--protein phosphotransferase [Gordonia terrae]|uniref:Phosphoenolpyruvate-protein phosphotransferase n=2 Tax=Gordonia terrae TaxID=2055 RepID=A0AAD0K988_9ACTN|nr:putative PEP-binding protein [Gordonia terrae]VTR10264.1 phosphoenolpyruvate-protein phosphotransferase [Clostridioides difficile]ANY23329.1 phosphoenolpyruvate--protein phosphotransferase [Gordonia terrae]AWO84058.1 phosphoenolpyruvate--protein phosphotransferase [Gordonia terrae]VTS50684.1 Phosphoenolpyruvate-protein phosphotransferase [Gordonia terrae]GAB42641.1 phosphoenolpyruvate--protein phosphotransferase [Gordonia terrae NBRC 100016]
MAQILTGTPVVGGLAHGPALWPGERPDHTPEKLGVGVEIAEERRADEVTRFATAAGAVASRLRTRASQNTGVTAEVLAATAGLAEDRGWIGAASALITKGATAEAAAVAATDQFAAVFTKLGGLMAERVTDLNDVRDRVLAELLGLPEPGLPTPQVPSVLLADDLAPADTAGLDPTTTIALVTRLGGPTSHTAIIARQLGIPCVVAVADLAEITAGTTILVDGTTGRVEVEPDAETARARVEEDRRHAELVAGWTGPGRTADGIAVSVLANVADGSSARAAAGHPVEGVGLFRTELAFLERADEPSVDEQAAIYREVLDAFGGQKVVIRTLDAGSDKPLRFVTHPDESNPALGVRGDRIALAHPEIRAHQLDAIAHAASGSDVAPWVMAPMIASPSEARAFAAEVRGRGLVAGVMIEVPAAAILAEAVLAEVDFVSIGTNDLTQYTMAADRMSADLAGLTDPWQPAVLSLIAGVAAAGVRQGKPVGVCGEAAADPNLACVLVGLGVTSLSSAPAAAAAVGARLGEVTAQDCRTAADAALATSDPAAAREAAAAVLDRSVGGEVRLAASR